MFAFSFIFFSKNICNINVLKKNAQKQKNNLSLPVHTYEKLKTHTKICFGTCVHSTHCIKLVQMIIFSTAASQFLIVTSQFLIFASQFSIFASQFSIFASQFSIFSSQINLTPR